MHLRGQHLISGENTNTRMNRLASQEFYFGRYIPEEEILSQIDEIQTRNIQFLAEDNFHGACSRVAVAIVGPEDSNENQFSSIKKRFKN
jgi:predicted Zn-dependent peptidase